MERIAMEEKRKEKNQMMILPKVCLWILFFMLIASIAQYIAFGEGIICPTSALPLGLVYVYVV